MHPPLQPLLHGETVVLRAPAQAWSAADGSIGDNAVHGLYFGDVRIVRDQRVLVDGAAPEHLAVLESGADAATFVALARTLDDGGADPGVRVEHTRTATTTGVVESVLVRSRLEREVVASVHLLITPDAAGLDLVKAGLATGEPAVVGAVDGESIGWAAGGSAATLTARGGTVTVDGDVICVAWSLTVPARGAASAGWAVEVSDPGAVVRGVRAPAAWSVPVVEASDERLARWVSRALDDLDALRLGTVSGGDEVFLAAGAPWFFTLFGRDSLWSARFMLPLGTALAGDTLRVLARLQGTAGVAATAEEPGKIMHELRRGTLSIPGEGVVLPPLYYGTVDATPLWVCVLHDAWRWGLPDGEVRALLPHLVAALEWMRDHGDADGDGLLEYVDTTGHGLANQGWKDSGDSVQWRDGTLAAGPIALCEVQAYAYEAAMHGADLLEHFGAGDPAEWRSWAARLRARFHEAFWIEDEHGAYPAIALDAAKRPVDTVTSNLGHLLGTGLLDAGQSALVARRLGSPELDSGYGLRTMSTDSAGYWPLSYHGGTVWTHDTAIAIAGLVADGHHAIARSLVDGLLAAAAAFDYRMPELHSGDAAATTARPLPYPAACRPQAWSAAAAVSVLASALGVAPTAEPGVLALRPGALRGGLRVGGLRFRGEPVGVTLSALGEVVAASGAVFEVG